MLPRPTLVHECALRVAGALLVAGIDEAGRGPLAGPVVAAAVILHDGYHHDVLTDSKRLSRTQRETLYEELTTHPDIRWAAATVEAAEIDRINILQATHAAMREALSQLPRAPCHALIDGRRVPHFPIPHTALAGGDGLSFSIAAASIIAKVTRDRLMERADSLYPGYEFARHRGYGTALHLARLGLLGPSPIHRHSFAPVRDCAAAQRGAPPGPAGGGAGCALPPPAAVQGFVPQLSPAARG